ncbi:3-deoxy-D-manno-octulosonic acid transferase [Paraglaciecola aquimarina]|uniref:3-deoxy-D-manno-octulosonic acid transferase n=1 Tax=Paraglaciecola algarum TaxID=3050085 RepID=A0ABS9DBT9_9ALTE|nr:3-deoxy-D-manno-octulosonic acid transferase [Paraglaciecola sp. G1-23]MCF2950301.1 3-deoxy-D-manno-octulosonic acid transferase [Paraglaciecola sp. G1-23]
MKNSLLMNTKQIAIRYTYSLLWLIVVPFLFVRFIFLLLKKNSGYTLARFSRFGICRLKNNSPNILIHCASVGEVVAIQSLVEEILCKHSQLSIVITTNTTTGAERVASLFKDRVFHQYIPYDFPLFMWLFLRSIAPQKVLINEMELWPNFVSTCYKMRIPLFIINGRMSEKSTEKYKKLPSLFHPMLQSFAHICAQGQRDYLNYLSLGVKKDNLTLTNNIKFSFNTSPDDALKAKKLAKDYNITNKIVLVAGSTHEPEEQILIDAFLMLKSKFPNLLLILVPRHPQRFEKVYQLLLQQSIDVERMSQNKPISHNTYVLLCDQMGILRSLYALADLSFVGGSIAERGGHNALEPAAFNVPIMMGSSIYNNPEINQTLKKVGALKLVNNAQDITNACSYWLTNVAEKASSGEAGGDVLKSNNGAIQKTLIALSL